MPRNERIYNIPDADLLQHSKEVATVIKEDIQDFKQFDATFQDEYPTTIQQAIDTVKAMKTDMLVIDEMAEKTTAVNEALSACNRAYRTIKYFVEKAFPDNKAVQNQFGFNDIAKFRSDATGMIVFMGDFITIVSKYKTQLTQQGCNELLLDSLSALRDLLQNTKIEQELFKKERGLITQKRVDKLNELYRLLSPVSEVASIIYSDDQARLARYAFPRPKTPNKPAEEEIN